MVENNSTNHKLSRMELSRSPRVASSRADTQSLRGVLRWRSVGLTENIHQRNDIWRPDQLVTTRTRPDRQSETLGIVLDSPGESPYVEIHSASLRSCALVVGVILILKAHS